MHTPSPHPPPLLKKVPVKVILRHAFLLNIKKSESVLMDKLLNPPFFYVYSSGKNTHALKQHPLSHNSSSPYPYSTLKYALQSGSEKNLWKSLLVA